MYLLDGSNEQRGEVNRIGNYPVNSDVEYDAGEGSVAAFNDGDVSHRRSE